MVCCYALGMETRDFRGIGLAAQEELRRCALFLIEQQGLSQAAAAEIVGVQRQTVNIWLRRAMVSRARTVCSTDDGCRRGAARGC